MMEFVFSEFYVSIALSVFALLASLLLGIINSKTSREALKLSKHTAAKVENDVHVYRIDAFRYQLDKSSILYVVAIEVTNRSTTPNSITAAELRIAVTTNGFERILVFQHKSASATAIGIKNTLHVPTSLSARTAIVGNCCFEIEDERLSGASFGPYLLRLALAEGSEINLTINLIVDLPDAEHLQKKRQTGVPV